MRAETAVAAPKPCPLHAQIDVLSREHALHALPLAIGHASMPHGAHVTIIAVHLADRQRNDIRRRIAVIEGQDRKVLRHLDRDVLPLHVASVVNLTGLDGPRLVCRDVDQLVTAGVAIVVVHAVHAKREQLERRPFFIRKFPGFKRHCAAP
jgi:hypothetical protein